MEELREDLPIGPHPRYEPELRSQRLKRKMGLAVTFIKTSNPALCRQKEFVLSPKIVHK